MHGYAIVERAQELSDGRVRLTTGTLYAALDRLNGEEMVRVAEETVVNGRAGRSRPLSTVGGRDGSDGAGMTGLERRYRWLLRAYPRAYRQYRADEMLETLLVAGERPFLSHGREHYRE
ncbi:hypothetical protein Jiend_51120 [Micromonospora endophytica]|nr:hypothetical protein Jiend_51120 [Micromonospora endophytica]